MLTGRQILLGVVCLVFLSTAAFAQGSIAGVVKDTSGAVLPGVTVEASSPALIEKTRSVVTDTTGQFKIVDLRPGTYVVTFTLAGFATVKREDIELVGSFAAAINAELKVGSVAETVTVTGGASAVDVESVAKQQVLGAEVLDAIPAGRSHIDDALLLPGLLAIQPTTGSGDLVDVGGTNNLQIAWMSIHDSRQSDTRAQVDGLDIRNLANEGHSTNFVPDMGSTQEVTFNYAASSAETMTGGLVINNIPREGGNTFKGSFFGTDVTSWFQGNNYSSDLAQRGLSSPNSLKLAYDANPTFGGPIVRDRLWFFSSARWQANEEYIAGLYPNLNAGNPAAWLYVPDKSGRVSDNITQENGNVRLTWQADAKNKFGIYFEKQGRDWLDAQPTTSAESTIHYVFPTSRMATVTWSSPLTNRLLLEARFANHGEVYDQPVPTDVYGSLIPVTEQSTGLQYRGIAIGPTPFGISSAPNINQAVAALTYVTGAHAFKVGFSDLWGQQHNGARDNSSSLSYRFDDGIPNQITERSTPYDSYDQLQAELGLYAQDRWTVKRLTIDAGIRFDYFDTYFPAQTLGPGTLVPNRNISFPQTSWYDYKDIDPRLGAAYDLFGDGKTAVKVSLGRFVQAVNPTTGNPVTNLATSVTRSWSDTSPVGSAQYYTPQCDLLNPLANGQCGAISDSTFGGLRASTTYDPKTLGGWGVRPADWEFSTSVQHQLAPRVGVDVGFFRRWYSNFTVTDNLAVSPTDFTQFSVTAPVDSRLPGGGGYVIPGFYNLNPNRVGAVNNYITFADNFGGQTEHWDGVDATMNVRLLTGAVLQGGLSTGRTTTDDCAIVTNYPGAIAAASSIGTVQSTQMCHLQTPFLTQIKLLGTYTVPKVEVRVAATFQSFAGPLIAANYVATNAVVEPSLGRPLSGGAANVTTNLVAPGTMYGARVNELDLRFTKLLKFGRVRTGLNLDLANALNTNAILTENNNYASWQVPQSIVQARLFKVSVQFDF
jgi:hypothetical protein